MIVQTIKVNDCTPQTIVIGRRGTYDTVQIAFDLSYLVESYGNGVAVLAVKRSQDESAYPKVTSQEDDLLLWTVSETDTFYPGLGECELMWYVDGGLAKTIIYPCVVMKDILATSEEAPDAYQEWVDALIAEGAETLQNAQDAAQSASDAESAKDDAVAAKEAAEEAAETAQEAVVHAPIIQNGYWYIWNDGQYVDTGARAEGQKGDKGDTGEKGDTGNGIASITKTGTAGLVDTYTVTYTDGTTTTFTVTNGAKGDKGDTGETGNGITSITKTGTSGNVDTYTITYTNGQTTTFTVTNGAVSSVAGKTGAVTLDANDVAFSDSGTYDDGTVGAELCNQKNAIDELSNNLHGVHKAIYQWDSGYTYDADGNKVINSAGYTTGIVQMPESGIRVVVKPEIDNLYSLVVFWEKDGDEFVVADDYPYRQLNYTRVTLFFPYQDGLYYSIGLTTPSSGLDASELVDVYYGRIIDSGGKLTNLAPINVTGAQGAEIPSFSAFAKPATGTNNYDSTVYSRCYGSVIRMQDADRVICSPEYNMIAWVYNDSGTVVERFLGRKFSTTDISGFNELDFSAYDNGYAVIAIWSPVVLTNGTRTYIGMGFLARYDDVLNNVFVEYKNGTVVNRMQYMYPTIADNLRIIKNLKQGEFLGGVINDVYNNHFTMPHMDEVSASPYNGKGVANELFCNVTLKSYITALKNKNSRIYNQMPKDLVPGSTSTYGIFGYGSVCHTFAAFVIGTHYCTKMSMLTVEHNIPGFTTVTEDFNFNRDMAMLMPGDMLVTTIGDGHIMAVTDVVQVNGVPHCVEMIEAYMPFVRFRYAFFDPSLAGINSQYQSSPFTDYKILLRPDYETIQAIRSDAYMCGLETDYTVGKVMCDRGSDSVYAKDNRFCYLTIADDNIDTVYLYKDDDASPFATVTVPADAPTQISDYRVIDVKSDLADNYGVITVRTNLDAETVEERFLYAEPKPKLTSAISGNVQTLNLTDVDNIAMVLVKYKYPLSGTEQYAVKVTHVPSEITLTGDTTGTIDIPNSYTKEIGGADVTLGFTWFSVVYKTDFGTFAQTGAYSIDNVCDSDAVSYW